MTFCRINQGIQPHFAMTAGNAAHHCANGSRECTVVHLIANGVLENALKGQNIIAQGKAYSPPPWGTGANIGLMRPCKGRTKWEYPLLVVLPPGEDVNEL